LRCFAVTVLVLALACAAQEDLVRPMVDEVVDEVEFVQATKDIKYKEEFTPNPIELEAPPKIGGNAATYRQQATNYRAAQDAADYSAMTHSETADGLTAAAEDAREAEKAEHMASLKAKVKREFNEAAADAADYRDKSQSDDLALATVKEQKIREAEEAKVVEEAEKTLAEEKHKLEVEKEAVRDKENLEVKAKHDAEFAGQTYKKSKDSAISDDNHLKEEVQELVKQQHYRQVARQAVVQAAEQDAQAARAKITAEASAVRKNVKVAAKKSVVEVQTSASALSCSDCTSLPTQYEEAGGTCADCATWASHGRCKDNMYRKFMGSYCAASCGCSLDSASMLLEEEVMPVTVAVSDEPATDFMEVSASLEGPVSATQLAAMKSQYQAMKAQYAKDKVASKQQETEKKAPPAQALPTAATTPPATPAATTPPATPAATTPTTMPLSQVTAAHELRQKTLAAQHREKAAASYRSAVAKQYQAMKAKFQADKVALAAEMGKKIPPQAAPTHLHHAAAAVPQRFAEAAFKPVKEGKAKADQAQTKMQTLAAKRDGVKKEYKAMEKKYKAIKAGPMAETALIEQDAEEAATGH